MNPILRVCLESYGTTTPETCGEKLKGHCFRYCGTNLQRMETSVGPKKMVRWAISSLSGTGTTTVEAMSSYSWCVHVTWVRSLAWRRCLYHTGKVEGAHAPRAISPIAIMNCTNLATLLMVWFRRTAKMKPPHLGHVICHIHQATW